MYILKRIPGVLTEHTLPNIFVAQNYKSNIILFSEFLQCQSAQITGS